MAFYPLEEHEYRYRPLGGSFTEWTPCTVKPIPVGDINIAAGDFQVRVMASGARPAGNVLSNDSAFTMVSAPPANVAPVAAAGADNTITLPTNSVTLTGSGTDSDGTVASYLWEQTIGAAATITTPTAATTTVTGLAEGVYEFRLTVTDDDGATHQDTVQITVQAAAATPGYNTAQSGDITFTDADYNASLPGVAKTGFTQYSSQSYVDFRTSATSLGIKVGGNNAGQANLNKLAVLVDGVLNQEVGPATDNTTQTFNITLPAGAKEVRIINTYNQDNIKSENLQGVVTSGGDTIEVKTPTVPASKWLFLGDSITSGAYGNPAPTKSFAALIREARKATDFLQLDAFGGRSLTAANQTEADSLASSVSSQLNGTSKNELFILLGVNDSLGGQTAAAFKAEYERFLDTFHTLRPEVIVWCVSPFPRTGTSGVPVSEYDTVIKEAVTARPWAKYINGTTLVSTANMPADGIHPNNTGHQEIADNLLTRYAAGGDPLSNGTLATPTLTATGVSNTQINTSWGAVANATGYVLERATASNYSDAAAIYTGANTSFSDTGRTAGTTYYYRVKATAAGYVDSAYGTASAIASDPNMVDIVPSALTYQDTPDAGVSYGYKVGSSHKSTTGRKIALGSSGYYQMRVVALGTYGGTNAFISLDLENTAEEYTGQKYLTYVQHSSGGFIAAFTNGSATTYSGYSSFLGWLRLKKVVSGGNMTVTVEKSTDELNWTVVHTFPSAPDADLFLQALFLDATVGFYLHEPKAYNTVPV